MRLTNFTDKSGTLGAIVAAMGCAYCFPAMASLGASAGLGLLGQYEGLFINTLLPVIAVSIRDMVSPPRKVCASCEAPATQ